MIESSDTTLESRIDHLKKSARFDVRFGLMGLVFGAIMLRVCIANWPAKQDDSVIPRNENADVIVIFHAVELLVPVIFLVCGVALLTKGVVTMRKIPKDRRGGYAFLLQPLEPVKPKEKRD